MHPKLRLALEAAGLEPEYQLGANYRCPCPNCGSHDNLAVRWNPIANRVQAHCWSCGSNSLYPEPGIKLKRPTRSERVTTVNAEIAANKLEFNPLAELVETYYYTDSHGKCWMQKYRYQPALRSRDSSGAFDRKDFLFEYREERETTGKTTGNVYRTVAWVSKKPQGFTQNYLYAYGRVLAAIAREEFVFLVDGEKDANVLVAAGYSATCAPYGDKAFPQWAVRQLAGAKIIVVADRDEVGYTSAWAKATLLHGQVYTFLEAASGKDTFDHFAAGGDLFSMTRVPARELYLRTRRGSLVCQRSESYPKKS